MWLRLPVTCLVLLVSSAVAVGSVAADPDPDASPVVDPAAASTGSAAATDPVDCAKAASDPRCHAADPADDIEYGLGFRVRSVWIPKSVLQLFVTRAAGGAHNYGYGADLTRRHGSTELQLGFEYEHVNVGQGVWINKGDDVAKGDEADYVLGPGASGHQLGWFTIEFTFINHAEINKVLSVRYGAGIGLGILTGELDHYNIVCSSTATNANPEPGCVPPRFNGQGMYTEGTETQVAYNLPPVFPVVNAILGLQIKPTDKWTINLEGGIRTLPFVGASSSYFF